MRQVLFTLALRNAFETVIFQVASRHYPRRRNWRSRKEAANLPSSFSS